jgi:BirA family biotin operon repressor/biotin-[acetyl-CoA-carboxylase] ligase
MSQPVLPPGWTLAAFETIGSTNDEAARRAGEGAPEGLVVWSLRQESGRGRRGRQWESPEGNLYCSTLLRPSCPADRAAQIGFVAALAVADTVSGLPTPVHDVQLKWPNDVLIAGAKICGILPESAVMADGRVEYVVLGIGLNVGFHPPAERTGYVATSLAALGAERPLAELLSRLAGNLHRRYVAWSAQGFAALRADWLARAASLGETIVVRTGTTETHGRFLGLDDNGTLILETAPGVVQRVAAGEVFPHRRAARG